MSDMTQSIAHAAAKDAGNESMRAGGRDVWAPEDYDLAVKVFYELWPLSMRGKKEELA